MILSYFFLFLVPDPSSSEVAEVPVRGEVTSVVDSGLMESTR